MKQSTHQAKPSKGYLESMLTTRRNLIKVSGTAAGSFTVAASLAGCGALVNREIQESGDWEANAWLTLQADGTVTFTLDRVEMGQGTYTGLTTLLAEELEVRPDHIEIIFAGADTVYRNPDYGLQLTGGSNSISTSWGPLREIGATARQMLVAAAAEVFQVPETYLHASEGKVVHSASGKSITYGDLLKLAAQQSVPDEIALKTPEQYKYIGKQNARLDNIQKVTGTANYGIDSVRAGMKHAVIARSPYIGGTLVSHNADQVRKMKGIQAVLEVTSGVAIVADSYWLARKAQEALKLEWQRTADGPGSSSEVMKFYQQQAQEDAGDELRDDGDFDAARKEASRVLESSFELPFLAHATMEPMNCVADVQQDRADIWTSTQAPDLAQVVVAKVSDLSLDEVHIHNQFIGGGFGRRLSQDFIGEAAEISFKAGIPIKLVWSREEDTQNDFYRPASYHRLAAAIDSEGKVSGWDHQIVCPKIMDWFIWDAAPAMFPWAPKFMYSMLGKAGLMTEGTPMTPPDKSPYEGADDLPYAFPALRVRHTKADAGVPVSFWRSVGHSHNAFVTESFVDELAHELGKDAYQYRRELLADSPRLLAVLDAVAEKGQWGRSTEDGVFQGISAHKSFGSYVAELVELRISGSEIEVLKVVCAIDCGTVINPDIVKMQIESCIVFGLTAALYGEITIADDQIEQSNFHDYQMLRMNQIPVIETVIIQSNELPTGVGEPGLPPLAPAMAGALFAATGERHRKMPFRLA